MPYASSGLLYRQSDIRETRAAAAGALHVTVAGDTQHRSTQRGLAFASYLAALDAEEAAAAAMAGRTRRIAA